MGSKLQQLDAILKPLLDAGVRLSYRDFSSWDHGKTVRIEAPIVRARDAKLHQVLLGMGFREIERNDYGSSTEVTVKLKYGRSLVLQLTAPKDEGGGA